MRQYGGFTELGVPPWPDEQRSRAFARAMEDLNRRLGLMPVVQRARWRAAEALEDQGIGPHLGPPAG